MEVLGGGGGGMGVGGINHRSAGQDAHLGGKKTELHSIILERPKDIFCY